MAEFHRDQTNNIQLKSVAKCIMNETSKIYWILQFTEFDRSKQTHDYDLASQIITVDTITSFVRAIYSTQLDGKQAYDILQKLDGKKIGIVNRESFNYAIAIELYETFGETVFTMSFSLQSEIKALHIVIANLFMNGKHPLTSQLEEYKEKKISLSLEIEFINKMHMLPFDQRVNQSIDFKFKINIKHNDFQQSIKDNIQQLMGSCTQILEELSVQWATTYYEQSLQNICTMLCFQYLSIERKHMKNIADFLKTLYQLMDSQNFFGQVIQGLVTIYSQKRMEYPYLIQIFKHILASGRVESANFSGKKFVSQLLEKYQQLFQVDFITHLIKSCFIDQIEVEPLADDANEEQIATLQINLKQRVAIRHDSIQCILYLCRYHLQFRKYITEKTDLLVYYSQNLMLMDSLSIFLVSYLFMDISQQEYNDYMNSQNQYPNPIFLEQLLYFGEQFVNYAFSSEVVFNGIQIIYNTVFLSQHLPIDLNKTFQLLDNLMKLNDQEQQYRLFFFLFLKRSNNEEYHSQIFRILKQVLDSNDEKLKMKVFNQSRLDMIYFQLQKQDSPLRMSCLEIIKSLISSGMVIETMHSSLINALIRNQYNDEENLEIIKIFRIITQRESELVLIQMLERGFSDKISGVLIESFRSFQLDSFNNICNTENPYLSFDLLTDYITIVHQISLQNKSNKLDAFLKESFFKNLDIILRLYIEKIPFFLMTINQKIDVNVNMKEKQPNYRRLVTVILELFNQFQKQFQKNKMIELHISRGQNQFNYEIFKLFQISSIDNIPVNVLIEVKYVEILPPDLNLALSAVFKIPKDISYADFMSYVLQNFQGKYSVKIKNVEDNSNIEDDQSLQKAIKRAMDVKIPDDEKTFTLLIRVKAYPNQQHQPISPQQMQIQPQQIPVGYPQQYPQPYIVYGGQRIQYPAQPQIQQSPYPQQMIQNKYFVTCKMCKHSFYSHGQIVEPCLVCNNYVPNQYSYQVIASPPTNLYATFGTQQIQQLPPPPQILPQIVLPSHAVSPQIIRADSPINQSTRLKNGLHSPYSVN